MRKALLALAASLALTAPAPLALAQAHDHDAHGAATAVQTTPADGAMGAAPLTFSATFAHAMRLTSLVVTPQGGDPSSVDLAAATAGTTVSAALPRLAPGNYTIAWTATGADNHTMTGRVRYMVH
ncbi:MAG: copper resistance protein CopC [Hyphomonadaceae bacterium]|nr:copper resistance protein CopC [Hyphomonadaceae bacterium]